MRRPNGLFDPLFWGSKSGQKVPKKRAKNDQILVDFRSKIGPNLVPPKAKIDFWLAKNEFLIVSKCFLKKFYQLFIKYFHKFYKFFEKNL
jgi:hypothetical protein